MKLKKIDKLIKFDLPEANIVVKGWVRTKRNSKKFSFIEINDGSCLKNMQVIADESLSDYNEIKKITIGSSVAVYGNKIESKGQGQKWEIQADRIDIFSIAHHSFPLQKKRHTDEFLRTIAHLRPRTNKYGAIFRIRSELSYAIHKFFKDKGFTYIHSPIITALDCEGAGDMFKVTTVDMEKPSLKEGSVEYSQNFFGKEAKLTVSGQLSAEMFAMALGEVYTFGPTFRAENSNTTRHVAEFWMVEPEIAFYDLTDTMCLAEEFIKYLTQYVISECFDDIELFAKFVDKKLIATLEKIISSDFIRIAYGDAVDILNSSETKFQYDISFGNDLQSEHERYLTEIHFKKPVIVYNYPKTVKPFYMRLNDDNKTVAAMDVLVPRIGEIIGGGQREERLEILLERMGEIGLSKEEYWWYVDSRKFGSTPHSGFGLGFERLIMLLTGVGNIRDVIPFPRTPNNIEF